MPHRILKPFLLILASLLFHGAEAHGASDTTAIIRPVYSTYMLTAGSAHCADTYLSPIKYAGWAAGFGYQRLQAMSFSPRHWVMRLKVDVGMQRTLNSARNATMWYAGIDASWAMMRRWRLPFNLSAGVGGEIWLNAGCLYLDRNGNNPASAKAALTVGPTAYATWSFTLRSLPLQLRYQASSPLVGAFFSPDYGELYYEIYLGNHSGLCHPAWWGNYFRYLHQLTADIVLGSTRLTVGYRGNIFSSKVNHLVSRQFSHEAIIGISGEWISINPRKKLSAEAEIISATY